MTGELVVVAIGAFVGSGELVARYRDAPATALRNLAAIVYILINAAASFVGLELVQAFGWTFGTTNAAAQEWTQALVAGFGAMALFRSSLFTLRIGDQDVGVGPSGLLQALLGAADRAVDRRRASARANEVSEVMEGVSFEHAAEALPTYCFALMQNATHEEQMSLAHQVKVLRNANMRDRAKTQALGLALMNVVGVGVLRSSVSALGADICPQPAGEPAADEAPAVPLSV